MAKLSAEQIRNIILLAKRISVEDPYTEVEDEELGRVGSHLFDRCFFCDSEKGRLHYAGCPWNALRQIFSIGVIL